MGNFANRISQICYHGRVAARFHALGQLAGISIEDPYANDDRYAG